MKALVFPQIKSKYLPFTWKTLTTFSFPLPCRLISPLLSSPEQTLSSVPEQRRQVDGIIPEHGPPNNRPYAEGRFTKARTQKWGHCLFFKGVLEVRLERETGTGQSSVYSTFQLHQNAPNPVRFWCFYFTWVHLWWLFVNHALILQFDLEKALVYCVEVI